MISERFYTLFSDSVTIESKCSSFIQTRDSRPNVNSLKFSHTTSGRISHIGGKCRCDPDGDDECSDSLFADFGRRAWEYMKIL